MHGEHNLKYVSAANAKIQFTGKAINELPPRKQGKYVHNS